MLLVKDGLLIVLASGALSIIGKGNMPPAIARQKQRWCDEDEQRRD
jgi:hypothetical protein